LVLRKREREREREKERERERKEQRMCGGNDCGNRRLREEEEITTNKMNCSRCRMQKRD